MMLTRCGWLTGLFAALVAAAVVPSAPEAWHQTTGPDFPAALLGFAQLALLVVAGWVLLVVLSALGNVRLPGVPRALRSALIVPAVVGAVTVVAVAGPAQADQRHDVAGLPLPDRPVQTHPAQTHPVQTHPVSAHTVTVRAGDTLWSIAAGELPASSSTTQVTQAWHAWYDANRDVVGADPNLIQPGQVFTAPDAGPTEQDAS